MPMLRLFGIGFVLVAASIAWMILGATMEHRTLSQEGELRGDVMELWGNPQQQAAPTFEYRKEVMREVEQQVTDANGLVRTVTQNRMFVEFEPVLPRSTDITAELGLDQRLRGLMWYSLYDLRFAGQWTFVHGGDESRELVITYRFADAQGLYDDFRFVVDGKDIARELRLSDGRVSHTMMVSPGQKVSLSVGYVTRGLGEWRYNPGDGVSNLENFKLALQTDFVEIDYPRGSLSPSTRERTENGWKLQWDFSQVVTGQGMGLVMPERIQPGELASDLAYSAPVSLLLFFVLIYVLATLRGLDIHPINYVFIAGAFFAFHLLFGYSVDHLEVVPAFVLSSVVSVILVVSYLRLVVDSRFAFVEAAAGQILYLVGFSLAHFWEGFTGLTVTVLSILTLFVLMQLTGRVRWSQVFEGKTSLAAATPATT